jgi:hypothetical protein
MRAVQDWVLPALMLRVRKDAMRAGNPSSLSQIR